MSEKEKIQEENGLTRRDFIKTTAALSVASLAAVAQAQTAPGVGQKSFKVGLIGCGGRANGALENQLEAAKVLGITLEPYAFCDYFLEKAVKSAAKYNVPAERCFGGPDGYHKLLAQPIDIVIMATPPLFRPLHLEASIKAGKHVFCEKPVAVDPQGRPPRHRRRQGSPGQGPLHRRRHAAPPLQQLSEEQVRHRQGRHRQDPLRPGLLGRNRAVDPRAPAWPERRRLHGQ